MFILPKKLLTYLHHYILYVLGNIFKLIFEQCKTVVKVVFKNKIELLLIDTNFK